jgi:hypothetical protein
MRCRPGARLHRADFGAPRLDPGLDRITNLTDLFEPGRFAPLENRGIGKGHDRLTVTPGKIGQARAFLSASRQTVTT